LSETPFDSIRGWSGEHVLTRYDRPAEAWIHIAVHSTRLGPATGGTRLRSYATPSAGLGDAMRLAEAMTLKFALLRIPAGGGKAVIAVSRRLTRPEREALLERYGGLVASPRGHFETGPDLGTSPADMDIIARRCPNVFGRSLEQGGAGNSGPSTALGVYHAIRASCEFLFGGASLAGRSVLVQGVGAVGRPLVERLVEDDARVLVSDIEEARTSEARSLWQVEVVPADRVIGTECDVFAPCATGGLLSRETIPRLRCRIVAGGANNQLAAAEDAARLSEAGLLYAPDFAINGGAAIFLQGVERLGWSGERIDAALREIGETLLVILRKAREQGITTCEAAERLAAERLAAPSPPPPLRIKD
jgi:leucine dehydrogenase